MQEETAGGTIGHWDHLSVVDAAGGGRRGERLRRQAVRGEGVAAPAEARRDVITREEEGKTKRRLIKCWLLVHAFFGWEGVCWEARKTEDGRVASTGGVQERHAVGVAVVAVQVISGLN